jgi:hypothetical protein
MPIVVLRVLYVYVTHVDFSHVLCLCVLMCLCVRINQEYVHA